MLFTLFCSLKQDLICLSLAWIPNYVYIDVDASCLTNILYSMYKDSMYSLPGRMD
jgi:hypothetical protein